MNLKEYLKKGAVAFTLLMCVNAYSNDEFETEGNTLNEAFSSFKSAFHQMDAAMDDSASMQGYCWESALLGSSWEFCDWDEAIDDIFSCLYDQGWDFCWSSAP